MTAGDAEQSWVPRGLALDAVRRHLVLTREELWVFYIGLGGVAGIDQLTAYLAGNSQLGTGEHNTIVQALNEQFIDAGGNHPVAYIDTPVF